MKNVNSDEAFANGQRLLDAMSAYINEPLKLPSFNLKASIINLLGGPDDAIGSEYDYRDTCEAIQSLVEKNPGAMAGRQELALFFLQNAIQFFEDCIAGDSLRAEIHRTSIEVFGCESMPPAAIENLIKQYELKRQLAVLESRAIELQQPEKKAA